jgi:hypothetical protein
VRWWRQCYHRAVGDDAPAERQKSMAANGITPYVPSTAIQGSSSRQSQNVSQAPRSAAPVLPESKPGKKQLAFSVMNTSHEYLIRAAGKLTSMTGRKFTETDMARAAMQLLIMKLQHNEITPEEMVRMIDDAKSQ